MINDDYNKPRPIQFSLAGLFLVSLGLGTSIGFFFQRQPTLLSFLCFAPFWAWAWGLALIRITGAIVVISGKSIDALSKWR